MKLIELTPLKKVITLDNRLIKMCGLPFKNNTANPYILIKSIVNNIPNVDMILLRKTITLRRRLNQLLRIPFRFTNVKIPVRTVTYTLPSGSYIDKNNQVVEVAEKTIIKTSSANIATRIETYKNKQVVRVYVDVKSRMLRPI